MLLHGRTRRPRFLTDYMNVRREYLRRVPSRPVNQVPDRTLRGSDTAMGKAPRHPGRKMASLGVQGTGEVVLSQPWRARYRYGGLKLVTASDGAEL